MKTLTFNAAWRRQHAVLLAGPFINGSYNNDYFKN